LVQPAAVRGGKKRTEGEKDEYEPRDKYSMYVQKALSKPTSQEKREKTPPRKGRINYASHKLS